MPRRTSRSKSSDGQPAPRSRSWRWIAGSVIALIATCGWWVSASGSGNRTATGQHAASAPSQGQRASIDPATGQLRPAEHDDVVPAQVTSAAAAAEPQERLGAPAS